MFGNRAHTRGYITTKNETEARNTVSWMMMSTKRDEKSVEKNDYRNSHDRTPIDAVDDDDDVDYDYYYRQLYSYRDYRRDDATIDERVVRIRVDSAVAIYVRSIIAHLFRVRHPHSSSIVHHHHRRRSTAR